MVKPTVMQYSAKNCQLSDKEKLIFLESLWKSLTDNSLVALDLSGNITAWNEGARRFYGYEEDEIIDREVSILCDEKDRQSGLIQKIYNEIQQTGKWSGQLTRVRKDGSHFTAYVNFTLRSDPQGNPIGITMVSQDISKQKSLEDELRHTNLELEQQNHKIQKTNRIKTEFLSNMSHELRTPLNGIIGFAALMHDGKVGKLSAEHEEYLGDILTSARHLLQLINDILDLSKIESGKVEFCPETVDVRKTIEEVCDILRTLFNQNHIKLTIDIDPTLKTITIDPAKFKQILYNYVSNAIKFNHTNGDINIKVMPYDSEHFRLEVQDTGIGIKADDISKLFIEFNQLEASANKKYQGTGLGLALTRRLVEAQGGSVSVKSTFGKGSSFYTILPNVPQKSQHNHSAKSTKINKKAKQDLPNILVIEDDPNDIVFLNDVLSRAEFNVTIAKNGKEAIARCTQKKFDAMTLDLILPDVSGFEILRSIRASVVNQSTPVIVVSVIAEKSISHAFTVHDFLTKPIPQNELIESLGRAGIYPHQEKVILVVDDDPMALKLIDQSLRSHEFNVVTKLAAAEGLAYIDDHQVDIIILDFLMPKMNGFEFLQELKKLPHGEDLPVIIWTNKDLSVNEKLLLYQQSKAIVQKGEKSIEALLSEINYHIFHTAQATRQKKEG